MNFEPTPEHRWTISEKTKTEYNWKGERVALHRVIFRDGAYEPLGGWVEKPENISPTALIRGNAMVYEDALIQDFAIVEGNAVVYRNAIVKDYAEISGHARITGSGVVQDRATVREYAHVCGNARIEGSSGVAGNARISNSAIISEGAFIYGSARIGGYAQVKGRAEVAGRTSLRYDIVIDQNARIETGHIKNYKTVAHKLMTQCFVAPDSDGYMTLYKRVVSTRDEGVYESVYDPRFIYRDGEIAEEPRAEISDESCTRGIHVSYPCYWEDGDTLIAVRVHIDDVITVQQGKARCHKVQVIGKVE